MNNAGGQASAPPQQLTTLPFAAEHRAMLAVLAMSALHSVTSRYAESIMQACVLAPVAVPVVASDAGPTTTTASSSDRLSKLYVEVQLLEDIHYIRVALRNLQECPAHARVSFYRQLQQHTAGLYRVLPDPLLGALAATVSSVCDTLKREAEAKGAPILEVELLKVVEALQAEVLRQTRQLTERASCVTLRFRHRIPFCP